MATATGKTSASSLVTDLVKCFTQDDIESLYKSLTTFNKNGEEEEEGVEEMEFVQIIERLFKRNGKNAGMVGLPMKVERIEKEMVSKAAKELFHLIADEEEENKKQQYRRVRWTNLLDFLLISLDPTKDGANEENYDDLIGNETAKKKLQNAQSRKYILQIIDAGHCKAPKREPVATAVAIETETDSSQRTFSHVMVSRHGRVGVYSASLDLLASYQLPADVSTKEKSRPRIWITHCAYMPQARCLLIADTNRSLVVVDAYVVRHVPRVRITGFPFPITCLHPYHAVGDAPNTARLLIGDENGRLTEVIFHRARQELFEPPKPGEKIAEYFWPELLKQQKDWVSASVPQLVHPGGAITRLEYVAHMKAVMSCCPSKGQLSVRPRGSALPPCMIREPRGVSCFALSPDLGSRVGLITGGPDGVLRLWATRTPRVAEAELQGHLAPIVDICWLEEVLMSVSRDGEIRIWHRKAISDLQWKCLQSLTVRCAALNAPGQATVWPLHALHRGPKGSNEMLLICDCHLIRIRKESDRDENIECLFQQPKQQLELAPPLPPPNEREPAFDEKSMSYVRAHEQKAQISGDELNRTLVEKGAPHLVLSLEPLTLEEIKMPQRPKISNVLTK